MLIRFVFFAVAAFACLIFSVERSFALEAQLQENKGVGVGFGMLGETQTTLTITLRAPTDWKIQSSYQRDPSGIHLWTPQDGIQVESETHTYTVSGILPLAGHAVGFAGVLTKESSGTGSGGGSTTFEAAVADLDIDLPGLSDTVEESEPGGLGVSVLYPHAGFPSTLPELPETEAVSYQELHISLDTKWNGSLPAGVTQLGTLTFTIEGTSAAGVAIYDHEGKPVAGPVEIKTADYVKTYRIVTNNSFISTATIKASFQWQTALSGNSQENKADDVVRLSKLSVEIVEIDARFAPSVERMNLKYSIKPYGTTVTAAKLEVFKKGDTTTPIFTDTSIAKTGQNVSYQQGAVTGWEGKTTGGDWIGPEDSDYTIKLSAAMNTSFVNAEADEEKTEVEAEISSMDFASNGAEDCRFIMNDPIRAGKVAVIVKLKNKAGAAVLADVPIKVHFSFSDPDNDNTPKDQSYNYNVDEGKYLGKEGDAEAKYWGQIEETDAGSDDGFKKACWAMTKTEGEEKGMAYVNFKPSAVGGDDFKIKAAVKNAAGTVLKSIESGTITIWRKIKFDNIYEMDGETHVSANATKEIIQDFFNDAFVEYEVGEVHAIPAEKSVKYTWLWKNDGDHQLDWATLIAQQDGELPLDWEVTDADGEVGPAQLVARAQITIRAQIWHDRIYGSRIASQANWAANGGIAQNALVSIKYFHPKRNPVLGTLGPENPDCTTTKWPFAWLKIQVPEDVHPDGAWGNDLLGTAQTGGIVSIRKGLAPINLQLTIVHEVAHATRHPHPNGFYRQSFGDGDHTLPTSVGMMTPTNPDFHFNPSELKILRGIEP